MKITYDRMKLWAVVAPLLVGASSLLDAASISFNLVGATTGGMGTSETAGVNQVAYWNNVNEVTGFSPDPPHHTLNRNFSSSLPTLVDSNGATVAGAVLSWTGHGNANAAGSGVNNQKFFTSEWDMFPSNNASGGMAVSFTLTNIPYATYDVYFYIHDASNLDHGVRGGVVKANGQSKSIRMFGTEGSIPGGPYSYVEANSTAPFNSSSTPQGTYLRIENVTGSTLSLDAEAWVTTEGGVPRLRVVGFQVVEVIPEPSSTALVISMVVAICLKRRRGR